MAALGSVASLNGAVVSARRVEGIPVAQRGPVRYASGMHTSFLPASSRAFCPMRPTSYRLATRRVQVVAALKWVFQPCGDGDFSHLEEAVAAPSAFDLGSGAALVGRVFDKADIVLPIPTVSGLHARLEARGDEVLVTDLDSTNGTFIDDDRIRPGDAVAVGAGAVITFGDQHLAQFKVLQVVEADVPSAQ